MRARCFAQGSQSGKLQKRHSSQVFRELGKLILFIDFKDQEPLVIILMIELKREENYMEIYSSKKLSRGPFLLSG